LDHRTNSSERIHVFYREVVLAIHEEAGKASRLPVMFYLPPGPGFASPRQGDARDGWMGRALQDHRVVLIDPRGTGRSAPITVQTLEGRNPKEQAAHIAHFRADSIAEDCEAVRLSLGVDTVSVLGEGFGGFCALTYLSRHSSSLSALYICGGLPPVRMNIDDVFNRLCQRVITRNQRYIARFPGDVTKVRDIVAHLETTGGAPTPRGGKLTARRFLTLGSMLSGGFGMERMHCLIEDAFVEVQGKQELDYRFLWQAEAAQCFDTSPLHWLLHEAMYCGGRTAASGWAAQRVANRTSLKASFDYKASMDDPMKPISFTAGFAWQSTY